MPFEVSVDPFYSESNIRYLEKMADYKAEKLKFAEHELIEE
ncbi:antitoxin [Clostridiales bacterium COT073_COT-073]|nr:antitoxin [Clostridiales bacterium COT073_COT-073]